MREDAIPVRVAIREESDVAMARKYARDLARGQGLSHAATDELVTAVSELARNIVVHAGSGEIELRAVTEPGLSEIVAVARDQGPGISDLTRALQDGYSTAGGLGLGLPSVERIVDELVITTTPGKGTTVMMTMVAR